MHSEPANKAGPCLLGSALLGCVPPNFRSQTPSSFTVSCPPGGRLGSVFLATRAMSLEPFLEETGVSAAACLSVL